MYPYCITTWAVCQGVFYIFFRAPLRSCITLVSVEAICRSPLDALIIPHRVGFVKGFFTFFFEPAQDRSLTRLLQSPRGKDTRLKVCTSLPLTMIVYHTHPQITRWNNAQNRDNYFVHFFRIFLLTNCWGYVIMEIGAPYTRGGAAEKATPKWDGFRINSGVPIHPEPVHPGRTAL